MAVPLMLKWYSDSVQGAKAEVAAHWLHNGGFRWWKHVSDGVGVGVESPAHQPEPARAAVCGSPQSARASQSRQSVGARVFTHSLTHSHTTGSGVEHA
jgi:hypothetical protein